MKRFDGWEPRLYQPYDKMVDESFESWYCRLCEENGETSKRWSTKGWARRHWLTCKHNPGGLDFQDVEELREARIRKQKEERTKQKEERRKRGEERRKREEERDRRRIQQEKREKRAMKELESKVLSVLWFVLTARRRRRIRRKGRIGKIPRIRR
jgi:hypothetical protein